VNRDADRQALLQLHELERRAHLEGSARLLADAFADDVWEASRGQLTRISRGDLEQRFAAYFDQVRYSMWEDVQPPHVAITDDGRHAWIAVQIEGRLRPAHDATAEERVFTSSWIANYERSADRWVMVGISSSVLERD
jgi:hypothetical protein